MDGWRQSEFLALEMGFGFTQGGVLGIKIALLIASYEQSFIERALEGSAWCGYFSPAKLPVISKCNGLAFIF